MKKKQKEKDGRVLFPELYRATMVRKWLRAAIAKEEAALKRSK